MLNFRTIALITIFIFTVLPSPQPGFAQTSPTNFPAVWFNPAPESADFLDLFRRPELWQHTQKEIQVFHFSPEQVDGKNSLPFNNLSDLISVDAFGKLKHWGIQVAIGAPAIKEWDCTGGKAEAYTVQEILNVQKAGVSVGYVTMDEPLLSGLGLNIPICHLTIDQISAEVAKYVNDIVSNTQILAQGPAPKIVDIEPYPSLTIEQIKDWTTSMKAHGFTPAAFHLDVNIHFVELNTERYARMAGDLKTLQSFFNSKHIPFGIIFWSGWDPIGSDKAYYNRVIDWTKFVHNAIGRPDEAIFSSWVHRCDGKNAGGDFACNQKNLGCSASDIYCGKMSVPINLPENDPSIFSHTRLTLQSMEILGIPTTK